MGGVWTKEGGTWKQVERVESSTQVLSEWRGITDAWVKRDGVWRPIWSNTVTEDWVGGPRGFSNHEDHYDQCDTNGYYGCFYPGWSGLHDWYGPYEYQEHHHHYIGDGGYGWTYTYVWNNQTHTYDMVRKWGGYWHGCPHHHHHHYPRAFATFPSGSLSLQPMQAVLENETITSMSMLVGVNRTHVHKHLGNGYPTYMTVWGIDVPPIYENGYSNEIECLAKIAWYGSGEDEEDGWTVIGEEELGTNPAQREDRYPVEAWVDVDPALYTAFTRPANEHPLTMVGFQAYHWPSHTYHHIWHGDDYVYYPAWGHYLYHWRFHCRPTITMRVEHTVDYAP